MNKKNLFLLILILLIATFLRFYKLGINPISLSWDEASIGYNAYSIAQTLKDEHGRFLPYDYFSAFGDYKPPVAIYLTAMTVKLFGLSEWAIRLPSALFGVLTVLLTFFLMESLRKQFNSKYLSLNSSLWASFFLAISPWHTLLSRQEFEANIATFFIVFGVWFFITGLVNGWGLVLGGVSLVLSIYTFNSHRIFVPLLVIGLVVFFFKKLWRQKKWTMVALLCGVFLMLPLVPHLLSPLGQLRFKEVNIFSDSGVVEKANERMDLDKNDLLSKIVHNRRVGYALLFLNHYMDHFNIDYLFFKGDINPKFSTRSTGQLFLIESVFLLAGIYFLLKNERKLGSFLLFWLLAGLVPAAMARETPHALRSEVSLPIWQIFSATGLYYLYKVINLKWRKILLVFISIILTWEVFVYLHNYYVHLPRDYSQDWQYGYKIAANDILKYQEKYDKIWVSDKYGRPYIFFLTYQKFNPLLFQKNRATNIDEFGFYHVTGYDKFLFGKINMNLLKDKKALLIGDEGEFPPGTSRIKDIFFLNGEKALTIAEI